MYLSGTPLQSSLVSPLAWPWHAFLLRQSDIGCTALLVARQPVTGGTDALENMQEGRWSPRVEELQVSKGHAHAGGVPG